MDISANGGVGGWVAPPVGGFRPSVHGFQFPNSFPGLPLPLSLAGQIKPPPGIAPYGLCGGMCFAALDFLSSETEDIPTQTEIPEAGSPLHGYLYRRQLASFGTLGAYIFKFAHWMNLPDDTASGTYKRSFDAFQSIRGRLEAGEPMVLGIVYVSKEDNLPIWKNHQVLAYSCTATSPTSYNIPIYDPNMRADDSVFIQAEQITVGQEESEDGQVIPVYGLRCTQKSHNREDITVRGFFSMTYKPCKPPSNL